MCSKNAEYGEYLYAADYRCDPVTDSWSMYTWKPSNVVEFSLWTKKRINEKKKQLLFQQIPRNHCVNRNCSFDIQKKHCMCVICDGPVSGKTCDNYE